MHINSNDLCHQHSEEQIVHIMDGHVACGGGWRQLLENNVLQFNVDPDAGVMVGTQVLQRTARPVPIHL